MIHIEIIDLELLLKGFCAHLTYAEKSQKRLETLFYFFSCKKALGCKHSIHVNIYFFCKQLHVFVFISNSVLHFSLSCL